MWHPTIVFLMRKLGWSKEQISRYTLEEIIELADEVEYQDKIERWEMQMGLANICATIVNTTPRKSNKTYKARDFTGAKPERPIERKQKLDNANKISERAGMIGPPKENHGDNRIAG